MDTTETTPIVVGVDGSPSSLDALRRGATLAQALNAPLRVVTTWDYPAILDGGYAMEGWSPEGNAREVLSDALAQAFHGSPPAGLTSEVREGPAASVLIDESSSAQMLIIGSRGHGGFVGLLLGSVSSVCSQHARCPVLIMHGGTSGL